MYHSIMNRTFFCHDGVINDVDLRLELSARVLLDVALHPDSALHWRLLCAVDVPTSSKVNLQSQSSS